GPLSVSQEYLALPDGAGRFPQDFSGPAVLRIPLALLCIRVRGCHPYRPASHPDPLRAAVHVARSYDLRNAVTPWLWPLSRSLATTWEIIVIFSSSAYLDVSVRRVRFLSMACLQHTGLPHSEIHGSGRICRSPWLIAAYHVLHRL